MPGSGKPGRLLPPLAGVAVILACITHAHAASPQSNKDYCAPDGTNLVFVIDTTTPYDAKDKDLLVRAVGEIFETMRGGDRVVIRTISESFSTSERLIDRCVPRCEAKNIWDDIFKCNQGIVANDTKKIKHEVAQALRDRLMRFKEQPRSDIIRTLSNLSREEVQRGGRRVMYVFSDMIENSDHMSGRTFFTTPTPQLIRYLRKYGLLASLKGAEVHVFGVGRDGTPSRAPLNVAALQKIMEFWKTYFQASNAQSIEISPNIIDHGPE
ncbi:MAG: hypothetical protein ABI457_07605 [Hyphomicrobium sp.]